MVRKKMYSDPSSIGQLYRKIKITGEDFSTGEGKLVREKQERFVRICKRLYKISPGSGKKGKFTKETKAAVEFLNWKLKEEEFTAAVNVVTIISLIFAFVMGTIVLFSPLGDLLGDVAGGTFIVAAMYAFFPFLIIAMAIVYYFQTYPLIAAKHEQTKALTYVPEMMGYMVMSIKLVPNLERAVEFAAEHGQGKIARDFKELIWKTQIGVYNSISEGLDELAYRWGTFSQEFKKALMMIRASVIENSEAKRYSLLDQTMAEMLESIRNKMEQYARNLSQPSTMLFYLGVLLPLLLIIILPVGSAFSGAPLANPIVLFLIYNVAIPLGTLAFAYNLIQNRPPTYKPPVIPDDYPGLPPKWKAEIGGIKIDVRFAAILVFIFGVLFSFFMSSQGFPPKMFNDALGINDKNPQLIPSDRSPDQVLLSEGRETNYFSVDPNNPGKLYTQELAKRLRGTVTTEDREFAIQATVINVRSQEQLFFSRGENDVTPSLLVFGVLITFSLSVFVLFYYSTKYKRKIQLEVQEMESEFKDSLYILASRLGENKPIEDAMKHVQEFLPDFKISKTIFAKTLDNIKLMGLTLESAAFDKNVGSVAKIPSTLIKGSMRMLIDSVKLGVNVAARSMISLSIQMQNAEKVNNTLKILISDITNTMKTMTIFIAPIVLGITTSLQRIVIVTISSLAASSVGSSNAVDTADLGGGFTGLSVQGFISPEAIANIATPTQFILIVALYIVELVIIMTYFTTKIEEDNDLMVRMNIARFMPIAIIVFVASMVISNTFLGVL
ncbi:hypothetical protein IIC68_00190 [archaeon]|nr:hypothetical protein [archaeon]